MTLILVFPQSTPNRNLNFHALHLNSYFLFKILDLIVNALCQCISKMFLKDLNKNSNFTMFKNMQRACNKVQKHPNNMFLGIYK